MSKNQVSNSRECQSDAGKLNLLPSPLSIGVLHEIARRCDTKVQMCFDLTRDALPLHPPLLVLFITFCPTVQVDFRSVVSTSKDLQFSVEVSKTMFLIESNFVSLVPSESSNNIIFCLFVFFFWLLLLLLKDIILCSLLLYLSFLALPLYFL